jgi:hypothetical protein
VRPRQRWFHHAGLQVTLETIDRAGKAREASLAMAERENVGHDRTVAPDSTWIIGRGDRRSDQTSKIFSARRE